MNNFKFLRNQYAVIYPQYMIDKPHYIKYIYRMGWLMYMEGCYMRDCPFYEHRYKNIWYSGFFDARDKTLNQ